MDRIELKVGDEGYYTVFRKIKSGIIAFEYGDEFLMEGGFSRPKDLVYGSRRELIEHEICYWGIRLGEELQQHISTYCTPPFEGEIKGFSCRKNEENSTQEFDVSMQSLNSREQTSNDETCEHASDGKMYGPMEWGSAPIYLCIKCGRYYR